MLSVIVPVCDERDNLPILQERLALVCTGLQQPYEIIYVDDGSRDGSFAVLEALAEADEHVAALRLETNCGQTLAIAAGLEESCGKTIILLDGDLQNDPADIPKLLARLDDGFDLVNGWRRQRRDPFLSRALPSKVANWLIGKLTGLRLHDLGCTIKACRREVLVGLTLFGEMHRLLPLYVSLRGGKVTEIEVNHSQRIYGQSKYGLGRVFKVGLDMLTAHVLERYATKPIYVFGGVGMISILLGGVTGILVIIRRVWFHGDWLSPLLFISLMLLVMGVQFVFLGLLAEVVVRIRYQARGEPRYRVVERTVGVKEFLVSEEMVMAGGAKD